MIDMESLIQQETGGGVAGAMAEAQSDLQTFMVPPQRVGWVMHKLQAAGIQPQTQPGQDGFVVFTVDARGAAIIQQVIDHQASKRRFGTHPVHKAVNTVMALVMTALVLWLIFLSFATGVFIYIAPSLFLLAFVWWARSILSSEKSTARLFRIFGRGKK